MRRLVSLALIAAFAAPAVVRADPDPYKQVENLHTVSTTLQVFGIVLGLGAGGCAVAAYIQYDQYRDKDNPPSPDEAESLRKQVQLFDKLSVIGGIASAVFLAGGITTYVMYRQKLEKLNKPMKYGLGPLAFDEVQLAAAPLPGGGLLSLRARF